MADNSNISKELKAYKARREARIMRRVKAYIDGEFTLDDFYGLEQLDVGDDRAAIYYKEAAAELQDLYEAETAKQPELKKESRLPELVNMTKDEFSKLSLYEQNEYYKIAPDRVREIVNSQPAYMDLIRPKEEKKSYKNTTLEQFKQMSLADMQALYDEDPALYKSLHEQRMEGVHNAG